MPQTVIGKPVQFTVREYEPRDMTSVLALLHQVLGGGPTGTRDERFWNWAYFNNPFGGSIIHLATTNDGEVIALRTLTKWEIKVGNTVIKIARSGNSATHPDYRGIGAYRAVMISDTERSIKENIKFVFGSSNELSRRSAAAAGYKLVSFCRPLIKVLNYPRFMAKIPSILNNIKKNHTSADISSDLISRQKLPSASEFFGLSKPIERLLNSYAKTKETYLSTNRTLDYLRWRYAECPIARYVVLYEEKGRELSGCAILRPSSRFNLKEALLAEMIFPNHDEDLVSPLLHELETSLNADYIIAYFPEDSFEYQILRNNGFHVAPKGGMNFEVHLLDSSVPSDPTNISNWFLSQGDLELF